MQNIDIINKAATITQVAAIGFKLCQDCAKLLEEVIHPAIHDDDPDAFENLWDELNTLDPNTYRGLVWLVTKAYIKGYVVANRHLL